MYGHISYTAENITVRNITHTTYIHWEPWSLARCSASLTRSIAVPVGGGILTIPVTAVSRVPLLRWGGRGAVESSPRGPWSGRTSGQPALTSIQGFPARSLLEGPWAWTGKAMASGVFPETQGFFHPRMWATKHSSTGRTGVTVPERNPPCFHHIAVVPESSRGGWLVTDWTPAGSF